MLEYDEPDLAQRLEIARDKLAEWERQRNAAAMITRLRASSPWHFTLVMGAMFRLLTALAIIAAIAVGVLPFLSRKSAYWLVAMESALNLPMPAVFAVLAICFGIAAAMASQAAVTYGRAAPLTPEERSQHQTLVREVNHLQQAFGAGRGSAGAQGVPRNERPAWMADTVDPMGLPPRAPTPAPPRPLNLATVPSGPMSALEEPTNQRRTRGGVPLGAMPQSGRALGVNNAARRRHKSGTPAPSGRSRGPRTPSIADFPSPLISHAESPAPSGLVSETPPPPAPSPDSEYVIGVDGAPSAFGQRDLQLPTFKPIEEEWLLDAIERSIVLGHGFPIQASLGYSAAAGLPFTLELERATPAMAIRAMVSFVEFLSQIPTPPRARIDLSRIPYVDRGFHRNVQMALQPYYAENFQVTQESGIIDIRFSVPDRCWMNHPYLPIEGAPE